jgi:hypothetical protein
MAGKPRKRKFVRRIKLDGSDEKRRNARINELERRLEEIRVELEKTRKRPVGRQTIRTLELEKRILDNLSLGASFRTAARAAGVTENFLREWRKDEPELERRCAEAMNRAVMTGMAILRKLMLEGDGQSVRFFLERRSTEYKREQAGEPFDEEDPNPGRSYM